ncbi:hypothetical protein F5887DRAFT_935820 [Amanita rubescens]|nr:hypothetical protein F5887DRAFT_935820 [Amanita rubescens]
MSAPSQNPDTRPLPTGWVTQYESNYKAWFYVNTNAQPPVTTWEHPSGPPPRAPPPPPSNYGPPAGPPPTRPGYEQGPGYGPGNSRGGYGDGPSGGYGGSPYDRPPENYGGPRGYGGPPPRGYGGPPDPYNGPPGGYGAPVPGGAYPQYGEGYGQGGYDRRSPVPDDRGRAFGGGMFGGRQQAPDRYVDAPPKKHGGISAGKVALGLGGGALALFAGKEFLEHEEHKSYEEGREQGYDQGFNNGFVDGVDDGPFW